jgi:hypothetical protein
MVASRRSQLRQKRRRAFALAKFCRRIAQALTDLTTNIHAAFISLNAD